MAVVIRSSMQEMTLQLFQFIQSATRKNDSCGVILAPCANVSSKMLEQAKQLLGKNDASLAVQFYYDDDNHILCTVLDNGTLGSTHYASLILKDFLQHQQVLQGQLIVSGFPEIGSPAEAVIEKFIQQAILSKGKKGDIRFFTAVNRAATVLIADTDDIVREFIKIRLELKGYRIYEAKDGQEAYNIYVRVQPDIVITELNLPIIDGYQLIREIEGHKPNESKVIVLTDKQLMENMSRAYESGAADYVTKPLSIAELEWKIKRLASNNI